MNTAEDLELYTAAVGRKVNFYLPYFQRADERGYAPLSWNWATFFFGVFWFLYRRQYRWAAILMLAALLVGILAGQLAVAGFAGVGTAVQLAFLIGVNCIYAPLHANGFYYRWVSERIARAKAEFAFDRKRQVDVLAVRGGPNAAVPALLVAALLLMTFLTPAGMLP